MSTDPRNIRSRRPVEPQIPDVYMPAMWPLGLQRSLHDWYRAWRQRSRYRQLLRLDDAELAKRDLSRQQLLERARLPLRQLVEGGAASVAPDIIRPRCSGLACQQYGAHGGRQPFDGAAVVLRVEEIR